MKRISSAPSLILAMLLMGFAPATEAQKSPSFASSSNVTITQGTTGQCTSRYATFTFSGVLSGALSGPIEGCAVTVGSGAPNPVNASVIVTTKTATVTLTVGLAEIGFFEQPNSSVAVIYTGSYVVVASTANPKAHGVGTFSMVQYQSKNNIAAGEISMSGTFVI